MGKPKEQTKKTLSITQLNAIALFAEGSKSQKVIAKEVGVSEKTLTLWKKQPLFLEALNAEVHKNMQELTGKAYQVQKKLLETSKNPWLLYQVSKDILDRAGIKAPEKLDITKTVIPTVIKGAEALE